MGVFVCLMLIVRVIWVFVW